VLWHLGNSEDAEEWVTFLSLLEAQGVRGENGLKLIIHDGGSGLCSALRTVYFNAEEQRCLFHKLRNLYQAIHVSDVPPFCTGSAGLHFRVCHDAGSSVRHFHAAKCITGS